MPGTSLKNLVEKHGIPCPVRCVGNPKVYPFTIIEDLDYEHYLIHYDQPFDENVEVKKECETTNDYEYDNQNLA